MSCIFSGKGKMKSIAPVTSDDRWVFTITKVPDMDVLVARFFSKKLAYHSRNQTEDKYYQVENS